MRRVLYEYLTLPWCTISGIDTVMSVPDVKDTATEKFDHSLPDFYV